jgi:hypothetical protein
MISDGLHVTFEVLVTFSIQKPAFELRKKYCSNIAFVVKILHFYRKYKVVYIVFSKEQCCKMCLLYKVLNIMTIFSNYNKG